jgi:hypothetical protein
VYNLEARDSYKFNNLKHVFIFEVHVSTSTSTSGRAGKGHGLKIHHAICFYSRRQCFNVMRFFRYFIIIVFIFRCLSEESAYIECLVCGDRAGDENLVAWSA